MNPKNKERELAIKLREEGFSLSEISNKLGVARSSASVWVRKIKLTEMGKDRIEKIKKVAVDKAKIINHKKALLRNKNNLVWVDNVLKNKKMTIFDYQLICSLLYWGEGSKFSNSVEFTNSDPEMVKFFLKSLVTGFGIDKSKLRVNMHLHKYHNELKQKKIWCDLLKISEGQFNKTFWKENSEKIKRENYLGCIRICYHSKEIVDKIKLFLQTNIQKIGP